MTDTEKHTMTTFTLSIKPSLEVVLQETDEAEIKRLDNLMAKYGYRRRNDKLDNVCSVHHKDSDDDPTYYIASGLCNKLGVVESQKDVDYIRVSFQVEKCTYKHPKYETDTTKCSYRIVNVKVLETVMESVELVQL